MRTQTKKQVGRPKGSKDSKKRKQKKSPFLTPLTPDFQKQATGSISQSMSTQSVPNSACSLLHCSNFGFYPNLVDSSCPRPEIVAVERQVSRQEFRRDLPIDEGPCIEGLEPDSENGTIDAELHSWTLQHLPWIEQAELYLPQFIVCPA
jgi:hypothetical protein